MPGKSTIDRLLDTTPRLWRGRQTTPPLHTLPTGHARLDARLPGRGWPLGAVTELISDRPGLGELSLLFPVLSDTGERGQWVSLVDPPWVPYPASLQGNRLSLERLLLIRAGGEKESLWACEQALRHGRGGAVLAWPERISFARMRRLQLAAEEHAKLLFLFRPERAARESSPAALRLRLRPGERYGTRIQVLKCRGSLSTGSLWIARPFPVPQMMKGSARRTERHAAPIMPDTARQPVSGAIN